MRRNSRRPRSGVTLVNLPGFRADSAISEIAGIEKGNPNGTKESSYASNPRSPSTQVSKPPLPPGDRSQLRFGGQYRWRLRPARRSGLDHLAVARKHDRRRAD